MPEVHWFWGLFGQRPGARQRRRTSDAHRRQVRLCVTRLEDRTVPTVLSTKLLFENFDNNDVNGFSPNWSSVQGATHDVFTRLNPPSQSYAIKLDVDGSGGNLLTSRTFDLSTESNVTLSYYYQRKGGGNATAAGDDLVVEARNGSGNWIEIGRQLGSGPAMTQFQQQSITLAPSFLASNFQFRFRRVGAGGDWFIDNVQMAAATGYQNYWSTPSQGTGVTSGASLPFSYPNTPAPAGGGSLTVTVSANLGGSNYLGLYADEGGASGPAFLGNMFVNDGRSFSQIMETMPLTKSQLQAMTASGSATVYVVPSSGVFASSNTSTPISVRLEYGVGTGNTAPVTDLNGPGTTGTNYTITFLSGNGAVPITDPSATVTDSAGTPAAAVNGVYLFSSAGFFSILQVNPSNPASQQPLSGNLIQPRDLAVDANGDLLVGEYSYPFGSTTSLIRVNPFSGAQEVFSSGSSDVLNVAVNRATGAIYIDDATGLGLLSVNPLTGAQTSLAPANFVPTSLAVDSNGDILGGNGNTISRINPTTGVSSFVAGGSYLTGNVEGIAVEPSGSLLAVSSANLVRINPVTGAQTLLSSGNNFHVPRDVAVGDDGSIYVIDSHQTLIKVDPVSGQQTVLTNNFTFEQEWGLAAVLPGAGGALSWIQSGSVTITNLLDGNAESLAASTTGTRITASYNAATGVLSLTGPDSPANYQQVLRSIAYQNTAAAPNTTPRQLQIVLNDGTLNSQVATSTVNVRVNSASFQTADTAAQGTWQGNYGGDGYNVVGDTTAYPSYVQVNAGNTATCTWAASTADVRAPRKASNPLDHVAGCWYGSTYTIDVNFTDNATHRLALYLLDWDNGGRSEQIDVLNATTGAVLDTRTVSNFTGGEYLVWNLSGHVQMRVTTLAGPNAVLSGLFFGPAGAPASSGAATFLASDTATQGTWRGVYGGDGYNVLGDSGAYPSYAQISAANIAACTWAASTSDVRALRKASNPIDHVAACWYGSTYTIDVNFTDNNTHRLALYLLDWDNTNRSERIDIVDDASGTVLNSQTASNFSGGTYLSWTILGHVLVRVTSLAGPNAVLSGLFLGGAGTATPGGTASFLTTDSTTQGTWRGVYGGDGYNVLGDSASYPSYATVSAANIAAITWAAATTDPRALRKANSPANHVAAAWYGNTFTIGVNVTDSNTHRLALYLLDWDNSGRSERIDIVDATTNQVLNSQTVSSFSGGEYLSWNISGNVLVRVTVLAGPNAVLSGLFLGGAGTATPGGTATFLTTDTTTQGTWQGVYGSNGYNVLSDNVSYPSYATVSATGIPLWTWAASTSDPRALQKASNPTDHIAACWYGNTFTIDLNFTDGNTHRLALYLLDWDNNGRSERIDVLDATTNQVLNSQTAANFSGGEYLSWNISGHVLVRFTTLGGPNAVVSGLFFG
jgi:hypothetical protein